MLSSAASSLSAVFVKDARSSGRPMMMSLLLLLKAFSTRKTCSYELIFPSSCVSIETWTGAWLQLSLKCSVCELD